MVVLENTNASYYLKKVRMDANNKQSNEMKTEPTGGSNQQKPKFSGGSSNKRVNDECPELIHACIDVIWLLWQQFKQAAVYVLRDLGGYQALVQWSVRNPHAAILILAGILVTLLPCLVILGIGISTLLMTFTGFLVLEGILLTIVAAMLLGCLGFFVLMIFLLKQISRST